VRKAATSAGLDGGSDPLAGTPEAIEARLVEIERKLDRLRSMYETFFSGVEKRPPNVARRELNRLMLETQQLQIRNAALRFRFQSLSQKWVLLTTYWNRTMREIEAGTYRKDLARVARHLADKGAPLTEQEAITLGIPAARARALVARQMSRHRPAEAPASPSAVTTTTTPLEPAPPPLPPVQPAPVPAPAPASAPAISDADLEALARRYDQAARTLEPGRAAPPLDKIKAMLARKLPELLAQPGAAAARSFEVAVKDGRVVLRARRR